MNYKILFLFFIYSLILAENKNNKYEYFIFPAMSYSEETSFVLGAAGGVFDNSRPSNKTTSLKAISLYSLKKQFILKIDFEYLPKKSDYLYKFKPTFSKYPTEYYGIGNHTKEKDETKYTPIKIAHLFKIIRIFPNFSCGIVNNISYNEIKKSETGGLFEMHDYRGEEKHFLSSLGLVFQIDKRDNRYFPLKGFFFDNQIDFYRKELGSDYNFISSYSDFRYFYAFNKSHILAFNNYLGYCDGNIPYHKYPKLGGADLMRGFREGRYTDKIFYTLQTEYRFRIYKKLGAVLFASVGDVSDKFQNFRRKDFKFAFGGGLRYQLTDNKIHLRVDYGLNNEGGKGIYITAIEAF